MNCYLLNSAGFLRFSFWNFCFIFVFLEVTDRMPVKSCPSMLPKKIVSVGSQSSNRHAVVKWLQSPKSGWKLFLLQALLHVLKFGHDVNLLIVTSAVEKRHYHDENSIAIRPWWIRKDGQTEHTEVEWLTAKWSVFKGNCNVGMSDPSQRKVIIFVSHCQVIWCLALSLVVPLPMAGDG